MRPAPDNGDVADILERIAALLEAQGADGYRVRAYRTAAQTVRALPDPVARTLAAGGSAALERLPGIGRSISALVAAYVHTGRSSLLERLEGQVSPEDLLTTVPGIGEELAARIHATLGVETLEELELAAHDGRLAGVRGIGPRRASAIRDSVGGILDRSTRRRARRRRWLEAGAGRPGGPGEGPSGEERPSVEQILSVDAEYRRRAAAGELPTLAPRRFNPSGESWLPVLHSERDGWSFTALFSNTARAHELGRTRDWVVVYYERDGEEDQCTVVSERRGPLAGRRVVRGREAEVRRLAAREGAGT